MPVLGDDLSMLSQRYQQLRQYEDSHTKLLQDLFAYSQHLESTLHTETQQLKRDLQNCRLDLDDAQNSRRNFQQQVQMLENKIQQLNGENDEHRNRHPYIAVLIDGDGLLFQEQLIKDGIEGGKRAAHALRAAIMGKCGELASKMEIVVKICANLSGLSTAMRQAGSISSENQFKQFTLGFTQAKASFDFIDVGYGKERADSKIREDARWHLNNVNCKMVVLGISHDAGYAPFLDELSSDYSTRQRLRIVEGYPTVRELVATGVEIVNFNDAVFRGDKIVADRVPSSAPTTNSNANTYTSTYTNGAGRVSPKSTDSRNGNSTKTSTNANTNAFSVLEDAQSPPSSRSPATSYASATNTTASPAKPAPTLSFPQSTTKNMQVKAAAAAAAAAALLEKNKPTWCPGPRGLDPPVTYNPVFVETVKKRKGKDKFCNNHVLAGTCGKDYCEYNHKTKPTPDEKKALAFLMRQSPCTYGQDCDYEECIYGHHCPSVRDGQCMQPYCRFPSSLHPPKTKFKQPFIGDDSY